MLQNILTYFSVSQHSFSEKKYFGYRLEVCPSHLLFFTPSLKKNKFLHRNLSEYGRYKAPKWSEMEEFLGSEGTYTSKL